MCIARIDSVCAVCALVWLTGMLMVGEARAADKLVDKVLLPHDPKGVYRWSEGTTICLDGKAHLMMLVTAFGHGGHDNTEATILEFHSLDGGLTWTPLDQAKVFQTNIGKQNVMSPSLLRLSKNELLCFFMVKNSRQDAGPWMKRSIDNGKTWDKPVRLDYKGYGGPGCDRAVRLKTGRIILPCWVSLDSLGSTHAYCFYSDDNGKTWAKTALIGTPKGSTGRKTDPAAEEPAVIELKDGRLMMILRTYLKWIYTSFSTDGGATWSKPAPSGIPSPGSMATIRRLQNGDLLLIYNWAPTEKIIGPWPRDFISSAISKDEGRSWSSIRHLDGETDFAGKITMANVCLVGDDRAVVTYSKSQTKKNQYAWRLQVLPIAWFYEGDTKQVYGEPYLAKLKEHQQASKRKQTEARRTALAAMGPDAQKDRQEKNLVAAYRFDERKGNAVIDTSRHGNDGFIGAGARVMPSRVAGRCGGGLSFAENAAPVVVADHPSLQIPTHQFTLEAWVRPTASKRFAAILTKEQLYEFAISDGKLRAAVKVRGRWDWCGTTPIPLHTWSHVAVTFDGKALRFYLNGKLKETCPWPGRMDTGGGKLHIGWNEHIDDSAFVGVLDEVRIWQEVRYMADASSKPTPPRRIGSERQLFLDDGLIASMGGLTRVVHQPGKHPDNPVLTYSKPWEGNCVLTWGSVLWDEQAGRFRIWYQTYQKFGRPGEQMFVCTATSKDGLTWDKPELGLIAYRGSKANNIVMAPEANGHIDSPSVFGDPKGGYRMVWHQREGIRTATSPDGLRWTKHPDVVVKAGDRNTACYDADRKRYRVITRIPGRGMRTCGLWESPDGETFERLGEILAPNAEDPDKTQFYGMIEFRYAGLRLGFLEMFFVPKRVLNTQLAYSRDGLDWSRACDQQTFLECGPPGEWDAAWVTPSHNPPIRRGDKLYIFYQGRQTLHWAEKPYGHIGAIGLAFLRVDGFASVDAVYEEGSVTTCPLVFQGRKLHVNANARPGYVAVEVLGEDGKVVSGFGRDDCQAMTMVDAIDHEMTWKGGKDLGAVAGKVVRMRFILRGAQLYSFWVSD